MVEDVPLKISGDKVLAGFHPIVLIGPNGSGKTRHGAQIANWNNADMIAALRNIALNENVSMQPIKQATTNLQKHLQRRRSRHWELSNEIDQLFSKLMAEDSASAIHFRDQYAPGQTSKPEETKLMKLSSIWVRLFPGRKIDFSGYSPKVRSDLTTDVGEYPAQQMSDGERVALYLAARVLNSESKIIIIDEPEVHFHNRLAVRFWNELESLRDECRFVYITHDLTFALSRQDAEFVIMMPDSGPQPIKLEEGLTSELSESLLAAASFSIFAKRIIFCEGIEGKSRDQLLYSAWFKDPETVIIPVGSSREVIKCTTTFANSSLVTGVFAYGLIDRDYWPDTFLSSLNSSITVLPYHEIENIFCLREVFSAVALHLGISIEEADKKYTVFIEKAVSSFSEVLLNKQISERFRRRCEHEFYTVINSLKVLEDVKLLKEQHVSALQPENWGLNPDDLFIKEQNVVRDALSAGEKQFMRIFPGKVFFKKAAEILGMTADAYVELICSALNSDENGQLSKLSSELEKCLSSILPVRNL